MSEKICIKDLPSVTGSYKENVDLSKTNWFKVGGNADVVFKPADYHDLARFIQNKPTEIDTSIIGVGSNLLVRDGGIRGVVVKLGRGFHNIRVNGDLIYVGGAVLSFNLAQFCMELGKAGLEFLVGIPGTLGGAVAMNAGAYGSEIADKLLYVDAISPSGEICRLYKDDMKFSYRKNGLSSGWFFFNICLQTEPGDKNIIKEKLDKITSDRLATQPIYSKTSGSTFTNPNGHKAWQLIDEAGCRGMVVGDAQVSEKHCNFLINRGNATAYDLEALGCTVQKRVYENSGIKLNWEIKRIGELKYNQEEIECIA